MSVPRKFDWDEARRLHDLGLTYVEIGRRLAVSATAIRLACNPEAYARDLVRLAERQRQGRCPDCGVQTSSNSHRRNARCIPCAAKAQGTTAREGELRCGDCGEWKPDADFPSNRRQKYARRGRHSICRPCQTIRRRSQRLRDPKAFNAYQRAYRRRQRMAA